MASTDETQSPVSPAILFYGPPLWHHAQLGLTLAGSAWAVLTLVGRPILGIAGLPARDRPWNPLTERSKSDFKIFLFV